MMCELYELNNSFNIIDATDYMIGGIENEDNRTLIKLLPNDGCVDDDY